MSLIQVVQSWFGGRRLPPPPMVGFPTPALPAPEEVFPTPTQPEPVLVEAEAVPAPKPEEAIPTAYDFTLSTSEEEFDAEMVRAFADADEHWARVVAWNAAQAALTTPEPPVKNLLEELQPDPTPAPVALAPPPDLWEAKNAEWWGSAKALNMYGRDLKPIHHDSGDLTRTLKTWSKKLGIDWHVRPSRNHPQITIFHFKVITAYVEFVRQDKRDREKAKLDRVLQQHAARGN